MGTARLIVGGIIAAIGVLGAIFGLYLMSINGQGTLLGLVV